MCNVGMSMYETLKLAPMEVYIDVPQIKEHLIYNIEISKRNKLTFNEFCQFFNKLNKKINQNKTLVIFSDNDKTNPENLTGRKFNLLQSGHGRDYKIIRNMKDISNQNITADSYKKSKNEITLCFVIMKNKKTKIREFNSKYCDFGVELLFNNQKEISLALHAFYKEIIHSSYEYSYENGFMFENSNITYNDWYDWFYTGDNDES